jgi:hypothetical protein
MDSNYYWNLCMEQIKRKKIIYSIITISLILIYLSLTPKIISSKDSLDLTSEQFKNTLIKAKKNDFNSLRELQFYYHLKHKDINSTCLVLCHMLTNFKVVDKEKGDYKLYNNLNCNQKVNCTTNALDRLKK